MAWGSTLRSALGCLVRLGSTSSLDGRDGGQLLRSADSLQTRDIRGNLCSRLLMVGCSRMLAKAGRTLTADTANIRGPFFLCTFKLRPHGIRPRLRPVTLGVALSLSTGRKLSLASGNEPCALMPMLSEYSGQQWTGVCHAEHSRARKDYGRQAAPTSHRERRG